MQNEIRITACFTTRSRISDVALDEPESPPLRLRYSIPNLLEIAPMPRSEVIKADNSLIEFEQCLDKVRTDKTGATGHHPGSWSLRQTLDKPFIR